MKNKRKRRNTEADELQINAIRISKRFIVAINLIMFLELKFQTVDETNGLRFEPSKLSK